MWGRFSPLEKTIFVGGSCHGSTVKWFVYKTGTKITNRDCDILSPMISIEPTVMYNSIGKNHFYSSSGICYMVGNGSGRWAI